MGREQNLDCVKLVIFSRDANQRMKRQIMVLVRLQEIIPKS